MHFYGILNGYGYNINANLLLFMIGSWNTLLYGGPKLWMIVAMEDNEKLLE
jgi:hypothetical protein